MKILADLSPIAAKVESRYAIPCSWVEQWGDRYVNLATDGRIAAIIPVEQWGENDVVGPLPIEATKAAMKVPKPKRGTLTANGSVVVGATTFDRKALADGFNVPQVRECIPKECNDTLRLTIDADLLYRLAKVLGEAQATHGCVTTPERAVTLVIELERDNTGSKVVITGTPIVVQHASACDDVRTGAQPFGIIMPMVDSMDGSK